MKVYENCSSGVEASELSLRIIGLQHTSGGISHTMHCSHTQDRSMRGNPASRDTCFSNQIEVDCHETRMGGSENAPLAVRTPEAVEGISTKSCIRADWQICLDAEAFCSPLRGRTQLKRPLTGDGSVAVDTHTNDRDSIQQLQALNTTRHILSTQNRCRYMQVSQKPQPPTCKYLLRPTGHVSRRTNSCATCESRLLHDDLHRVITDMQLHALR